MQKEHFFCGEFTAEINSSTDFRIKTKGKDARHPQRLQNITELVKELISIPEDWTGEKHFVSKLKNITVWFDNGKTKITIQYDHEDREKHPQSEYDHRSGAYSTDQEDNGKCYHAYPSLMGDTNGYELEGISSLDELFKDSAVYQAFRKRYEKIVLFNHEYTFWEDDSYLFF